MRTCTLLSALCAALWLFSVAPSDAQRFECPIGPFPSPLPSNVQLTTYKGGPFNTLYEGPVWIQEYNGLLYNSLLFTALNYTNGVDQPITSDTVWKFTPPGSFVNISPPGKVLMCVHLSSCFAGQASRMLRWFSAGADEFFVGSSVCSQLTDSP